MSELGDAVGDASPPSPEQLEERYTAPIRDMLKDMGVLSDEQISLAFEGQAIALALREAIYKGRLTNIEDLPQFDDERVDYLTIARFLEKGEDLIQGYLEMGRVGDEELANARVHLDSNRRLNNPGEIHEIPFFGKIASKMFRRNEDQTINNMEEKIAAVLTLQQAMRAAQTADRLSSGQSDPEVYYTRREFHLSPVTAEKGHGQDRRLTKATATHFEISHYESTAEAGKKHDVSPYLPDLQQAFIDAQLMLEDVGMNLHARYTAFMADKYLRELGGQTSLFDDHEWSDLLDDAPPHQADGATGTEFEGEEPG